MMVGLVAFGMSVDMGMRFDPGVWVDESVADGQQPGSRPVQKIPVVGDDCHGLGQIGKDIQKPFACVGIKLVGGFVQKQRFGLHGKDGGQSDEFFLPAGKTMDGAVAEMGEVEHGERCFGAVAGFFSGLAEIERAEGHIFDDCGREKLIIGVLKEQTHGLSYRSEMLFSGNMTAFEKYLTRRRSEQAHGDVEECGLACAVGADQSKPVPVAKFEIETSEHMPVGPRISVMDIPEFDNGWRGGGRMRHDHSIVMPQKAGRLKVCPLDPEKGDTGREGDSRYGNEASGFRRTVQARKTAVEAP